MYKNGFRIASPTMFDTTNNQTKPNLLAQPDDDNDN